MKENVEQLQAQEGLETPGVTNAVPKGFSNIAVFPSKGDSEMEQAKATAKKLNIPFVDPLNASIEPDALALLDRDVAKRRQVVPIRLVNDILLVAMASPEECIAVKSLELLTGYKIRPAAASKSAIYAALREVYDKHPDSQEGLTPTEEKEPQKDEDEAFTISVISNKGGVGKTHFSINLTCSLAKTGAKVLLIDADLGSADISNKLSIFPEHHLLDFLEKDKEMEDLVVSTGFGFDLICGTYGEFKLANLYYAQKVKFIKHFQRIAKNYDFAVFDLGAGIARTVLDFALGAGCTVIVTTPQDLISGYACIKASFSRFKELEEKLEGRLSGYEPHLTFSPMMVINQVKDLEQGIKLYDTICKTADENVNADEGRFSVRPEYLGAIPYDKENIRMVEGKKKPLLFDAPYSKVSQCIKHMSKRFCDPDASFDPRVKFKHSFKRFAAILTQKM
ncbi:MAG: AAA family ATPase [Deltaproteobacteria bacterium]|nr:AAA family ATPase [Deltaproteobacteria bacterium]MBW2600611.1 AAA family ATPase [Deltaproteobacteria bacterium]